MVDTLRCDETFTTAGSPDTPVLRPRSEVSDLVPQFCRAVQDRAILRDHRVLTNMLQLEGFYMATLKHYHTGTNEIKLHMRKIVVDWMLEVTIDQRCHVDVFLLATNIMDRYLDTNPMPKKQFQLLGAAAIFLASKMVEPSPIPALTLVKYTADTYDRDELLVSFLSHSCFAPGSCPIFTLFVDDRTSGKSPKNEKSSLCTLFPPGETFFFLSKLYHWK